jgi:hypothetical protein
MRLGMKEEWVAFSMANRSICSIQTLLLVHQAYWLHYASDILQYGLGLP